MLLGYINDVAPNFYFGTEENALKNWMSKKYEISTGAENTGEEKLGAFKNCTIVLMGLFDHPDLEVKGEGKG